jgi:hypothetical protein
MSGIWDWFKKVVEEDDRKLARHPTSDIVAYYWDGSTPVPHPIRDISVNGAFLITEERWRPGTIVTMTLQRAGILGEGTLRSIAIQARVVRLGADGVGLKFILTQASNVPGEISPMGETADRKTVQAFLQRNPTD